ncbi:hypothetical protein Agub_g9782 [Astrephomene gubernaculifera]|uniref:Partial AB-hydrolase lipase domain-containing protein n=1 Tax=Astrephomene gubernaculifera TaxID=47775 RepID=A0AAD3HPJ7_9CHLO|nr:hypothetical protein Agub_g9782 [Astrephomene gubernaculifera]
MWGWLLAVLTWAQLQVIEPVVRWWEEVVLGSWEEWVLALVRQGFEETTRFLNGLGAWFLSLFSKHSYREQLRRSWQENSWQQWWGEVARRPSTLNALVANLVAQQQQAHGNNPSSSPYTPAANGGHLGQPSLSAPPLDAVLGDPSQANGSATRPLNHQLEPGSGATNAPESVAPTQGMRSGPSTAGASAWWPRPATRLGGHPPDGAHRPHGAPSSLAARLERPVVFVQQSGMGILDELAKRRHGLIEDAKMAAQLAVSRAFEIARSTVRAVLFLPSREALAAAQQQGFSRSADGAGDAAAEQGDAGRDVAPWRPTDGAPAATASAAGSVSSRGSRRAQLKRSKSAHVNIAEMAYQPGAGAGAAASSIARRGLQRSRSFGRLGSSTSAFGYQATETPSDALAVIRAAGYPHELHTVTTEDGYVLRLERIPRPGARDVVFFMHGVLDTSIAWVSGGVTGSQAFAAWEAGMDVWLGNSRGNAPRQHQDPARRGRRYWQYNINHMGMYDIGAQLDHIHNVKCAELGAGNVTLDLDHLGPLAGSFFGGGAAGEASRLLPGRAISTGAGRHEETALRGLAAGARSSVRIRHSNSDGNLYRWGSAHSAASSSDASAAAGPLRGAAAASRPSPAAPSATMDDDHVGSGPDATVSEGSSNGVAVASDDAAAAPVLSAPQRPHRTPDPAFPSAPSAGLSAASLSHAPSSHGPLSPMHSCDGSLQDGGAGSGSEGGSREKQLAGDACPDSAGVEHARQQQQHAGACRRPSATTIPTLPSPSAAAASSAAASSSPSTSSPRSLTRSSAPLPAMHRNAVTLTVASPLRGAAGGAFLDAAALVDLEGHRPRAGTMTPEASGGTAGMTTFTLEAKTRADFGTHSAAAAHGGGSGAAVASGGGTEGGGRRMSGSGVSAAASVLDAVGSVLGPAADAVTLAVASAAATAGAAIATAAASATQLLQPLQQAASQRFESAPDAGTAPSDSTPFATVSAQGADAADVERQDASGPAALGQQPRKSSSDLPWLDGMHAGSQQPRAYPAGPVPHPQPATASPPFSPSASSGVPLSSDVAATQEPVPAAASVTRQATLPVPPLGFLHPVAPASAGSSFRRACSTNYLPSTSGAYGYGTTSLAAASAAQLGLPPASMLLTSPERAGSGFSTTGSQSSASDTAAAAPTTTSGSTAHAANGPWFHAGGASPYGGSLDHVRCHHHHPAGAHGHAHAHGDPMAAAALPPLPPPPPYKLRAVAHSLGGMSMLIHLVNRLREGRPHNVSRLLLLTPAGFHKHCPKASKPVMWTLPIITRVVRAFFGRTFCFPLYIPTFLGRALTFKMLLSASRIPGLGELLRVVFKALLDGDISQWDRAMQMPHYSAEDMPAISVDQVLHLIQLVNSDSFRLYDYGSPAANTAHYGSPAPPDVASEYWRLDLPVHLVAGRRDGIIPAPNIRRHLDAMRAQGVAVSYREFDFGHLDFTFGVKEELRMYLMRVLRM